MKIDTVFIDRSLPITPDVDYLLSKIEVDPVPVDSSEAVYGWLNQKTDPVTAAKKMLYITTNKGAVIKKCPGTSTYTCCDYTILHTGTFCTMDCSYCILQAYFHPPVLQYFSGTDQIRNELASVFSQDKILRIGTGEYTDSLIWEKITQIPRFLVETFSAQNTCVLELKTKTVNIDSLLTLEHNRKTILAWSVNTPDVIRTEERGTASLAARLRAASKAAQKGYPVAFHFDPMVIYPGCDAGYAAVAREIFNHIPADQIVWISIGSFRFMPPLKSMIQYRFPKSGICYGEFICGLDNKMRYFRPQRTALYQHLIETIRSIAPDVTLYFCMESEAVWMQSMGFFPGKEGELGHLLDRSAVKHCGLNPELL